MNYIFKNKKNLAKDRKGLKHVLSIEHKLTDSIKDYSIAAATLLKLVAYELELITNINNPYE